MKRDRKITVNLRGVGGVSSGTRARRGREEGRDDGRTARTLVRSRAKRAIR